MLADLFASLKIPNKFSGAVAGERLLYLSSCLVVLVSYLFKKKSFLFLLISIFTPSIMEQPSILSFLPIVIRAIGPEYMKMIITCLSYFFNFITQKVIDEAQLPGMKQFISETLC